MESGAGLIVAGAYEWILGGVTKRLVNPSACCSLRLRGVAITNRFVISAQAR